MLCYHNFSGLSSIFLKFFDLFLYLFFGFFVVFSFSPPRPSAASADAARATLASGRAPLLRVCESCTNQSAIIFLSLFTYFCLFVV